VARPADRVARYGFLWSAAEPWGCCNRKSCNNDDFESHRKYLDAHFPVLANYNKQIHTSTIERNEAANQISREFPGANNKKLPGKAFGNSYYREVAALTSGNIDV
jgi:hypothetical protein